MRAYVGLPPSRTSPYPEIPWSVSMRMRVEWNGAPLRRATRRSVIFRLDGREAARTLASGLKRGSWRVGTSPRGAGARSGIG